MLSDVSLSLDGQVVALVLSGAALAAFALYLRLRVFLGKLPGGVDTWYYLASADALRRQKRLPISLPQYLLHDTQESYPAGFPLFLALLPRGWLKRHFRLVAPLVDTFHLLLLYLLTYRLTDSVLAAATAGLIYAVTPQLISETRSLNGRSFATLLQTLAMLALVRSMLPIQGLTRDLLDDSGLVLQVLALVLIALLYNTHTSTTIAFGVSAATLGIVMGEPRFFLLAALGLPAAIVLSGGYYIRVIHNHLNAARFWFRNLRWMRAHQLDDSPVLAPQHLHESAVGRNGAPPARGAVTGMYSPRWRARAGLLVRLLGENPFVFAMLFTPVPDNEWARHMYWWAVAVMGWAFATTFIPPLRIVGPGYLYMKASVFPTAYALAVMVNVQEGALSPVGLAVLISLVASLAALAYFYRIMATRETEHTAQTPPDLAAAATYLRGLPGRNVLVLPNMYADFIMYNAEKAVVWGGHSGNLEKLEEFFPVLRRPLEYFVQRYQVDYLVLDRAYAPPERLQFHGALEPLRQFGSIVVYAVSPGDAPVRQPVRSAEPVSP